MVVGPWLRTADAHHEFDPPRFIKLLDCRMIGTRGSPAPLVVNSEKEIDHTGDDVTGWIAPQLERLRRRDLLGDPPLPGGGLAPRWASFPPCRNDSPPSRPSSMTTTRSEGAGGKPGSPVSSSPTALTRGCSLPSSRASTRTASTPPTTAATTSCAGVRAGTDHTLQRGRGHAAHRLTARHRGDVQQVQGARPGRAATLPSTRSSRSRSRSISSRRSTSGAGP